MKICRPNLLARFSPLFFFFISLFISRVAHAESVTLLWDPSELNDAAAYRIYWGTESRNYTSSLDVGFAHRGTVSGLLNGVTYYFAVTAIGFFGRLESDFSDEVSWDAPEEIPPFPSNFVLLSANASLPSVTLGWDSIARLGITNYQIYVGQTSGTYEWTTNVGTNLTVTITNLANGFHYYFTITAMRPTGESEYGDELDYDVPVKPLVPDSLSVGNE